MSENELTEWAPCPSFPGYEATRDGRVRKLNGREVPQRTVSGCAVVEVAVRRIPGQYKTRVKYLPRKVHRMVADAFMGPCVSPLQVNHKDGNKLNNRLENLEYVTRSQNAQHAIDSGLSPRKLDSKRVASMREAFERNQRTKALGRAEQIKALASEHGVARDQVRKVLNRKAWRWVG